MSANRSWTQPPLFIQPTAEAPLVNVRLPENALTFVDGPYGMGKYQGDEIRTPTSERLYREVLGACDSTHLVICGTFRSLAWIAESQFVPERFQFRVSVVWHKPDWVGGSVKNIQTFSPRHELLLHYSLPDAEFYADAVRTPYGERAKAGVAKKTGRSHGWVPNPLGARRGDVWTIPGERLANKQNGRTLTGLHPCQKPSELLRILVLATSLPGDRIYEPFLGSNSLKAVCETLGRQHLTFVDAWDFVGAGTTPKGN